jgi:hypothetical protein
MAPDGWGDLIMPDDLTGSLKGGIFRLSSAVRNDLKPEKKGGAQNKLRVRGFKVKSYNS